MMNASEAFSDYQVTYSVNRSINVSPSKGRLHKQRQSSMMGPTICLINRSRSKIDASTAPDERSEEVLGKLFMLSLQIERLTEENRQLRMEKEEYGSMYKLKEVSSMKEMKEENQRLKINAQRLSNSRAELQRRYTDQIFQLKQKIATSEAENRTLNRRVRQNEKQLQEMQQKGRINESMVDRHRMQTSKMMELSGRFDSTNLDLQKSITREKTMEVQSLNQKVQRCEEIIRDQKFIISGQKQEISKGRREKNEIQQIYKKELQLSKRQLEGRQHQTSQVGQEQVKRLQSQIRQWQQRVIKAEGELKQKCLIIANQVRTISQQDLRVTQLARRNQDMQFNNHSKLVRAEEAAKLAHKQKQRQTHKLMKESLKYQQQIEILKSIIEQYKTNIAQKDNQVHMTTYELNARLREKQQEVKKLRKRGREQQSQTKMSKSLSVDNINITNRLKASQVSLGHIVSSVMQLKESNDRSSRLIGRSAALAKEAYYAK